MPLAIEQPVSAAQPATRSADLSMTGEGDADPESAAQGGQLIAHVEVAAMRALEQIAVLSLSAEHVGAAGQQLGGVGEVGDDDVREVLTGLDCGIGVESVNGLQPGDIIEAYTSEEVARTL